MKIRVVAVGKARDRFVRDGVEHYARRLRTPWSLDWVEVSAEKGPRPGSGSGGRAAEDRVRDREGERILARLDPAAWTVLLDERGEARSSEELAALLGEARQGAGRGLDFVIGGAWGVAATVASRARFTLSLSRLTFPHQLARLVLAEQIYRGVSILDGSPYHHGVRS